MKPRILLIGSEGQVAWELRRSLGTLGDLAVAHRHSREVPLDLARPDSIVAAVRQTKPDWIVNAAAYTAVDRAEEDVELAHHINGEAVGVMAEQARSSNALLVHYSTDYVFDGLASQPYTEDAATTPHSVYGQSKLQGEQAVQDSGAAHLILRTSWVHGARGSNFLLTMRRLARERRELRIVADQHGAPTWSRHIAAATGQVLAQLGLKQDAWREASGIYHLAAAGQCSWFDFASHIVNALRRHERLAVERIDAIGTEQYPLPAPRPAYSVLDCDKLARRFGIRLPDWRVGVDLALEELTAAEN